MTTIKGILFDKDGTLIDFEKTWHAIGDSMALEMAAGDRARADELMVAGGYDAASGRFRPDSVFAAGTNAEIVELWTPGQAAAERHAAIARFDNYCALKGAEAAVALPGVIKALRGLYDAGFKLGVATNDSTSGAERIVLALGVASLFKAVYGYDAVARPKPEPDSIAAFCDQTGLSPSEIAMVGDNRHDMQMGRAGGVGLNVAVLSGTGTVESLTPLADVVLDSVADLPAYLSSRNA